jgi:hypothetical protein
LFFFLGRRAVFLEQLLCRVVLCGFLQSLDGCVALLVELLEVSVGVANAVVEVARERVADAVDAVYVRCRRTSGYTCVCLQYWSTSNDRPLNDAPIAPPRHKRK